MNLPGWARWLLSPLEWIYRLVLLIRTLTYRRGWRHSYQLPAKVISVGNLTVGGTGKTPLVLWLAAWLRRRGARVAILTRGYGRRDRRPLVMNGLGEVARFTPGLMGDEPILFARRVPEATVGIGANRFLLARQILALERDHPPHVFLLDDGFQHLRLQRDLDIVVIDASNPFGNGAVLPAGRLREPKSALRRADIVVLTRAVDPAPAELMTTLRLNGKGAPVFRSWTELDEVRDPRTGRQANLFVLKQQPVLAFCGIGNPDAFWNDLHCWGFQLVSRWSYPDHYRYRERDLRDLQRAGKESGAAALLTTEKDGVNLPKSFSSDLPVFCCRIRLVFEDADGFTDAVLHRLQSEAD